MEDPFTTHQNNENTQRWALPGQGGGTALPTRQDPDTEQEEEGEREEKEVAKDTPEKDKIQGTRPDTTTKGRGEEPGCHQRQRRGPRRKRLRSNGRCSSSRTPTVTSSGPSPRAGAAAAADNAAPVTVFSPATATKVGAAERAELPHHAWAPRAAAEPAQGRPPTYRPLTSPPPLSGPECRADLERVAPGGDTASHHAFPWARASEWLTLTLPRKNLTLTPTSLAAASAVSPSFLLGLGARSGRERARRCRRSKECGPPVRCGAKQGKTRVEPAGGTAQKPPLPREAFGRLAGFGGTESLAEYCLFS
ncbi:uncharacterized protein DKFZp434B061-like [Lutra lutra]|uniref:uncharacterized protein DKFZp434B061-like n=1 Tax=Lutra lutra TaxID=9657 RepID=UPI001FD2710B|nr:uncharacterized protein DKFZp434B061-like [Lutra lutra]